MEKEKINVYDKSKFSLMGFNMPYYFNTQKFSQLENYDNVYVYMEPADTFLHTRGLVLSAATKVTFVNGTTVNLVVYDSSLCQLPENVQKFLIMHEAGHAVNGHLVDITNKKANRLVMQRAFGLLPRIEVEADKFAAAIIGIGNAKDAIRFMIKNTNLPFNSKLELRRRYCKL